MKKESRVCGFCELVPEDGILVYEEWIGIPVCFDCYLELKGLDPYMMVDFCQRCGSDDQVTYYPFVKKSLCRRCAKGIPGTAPS
jgi:hypothetical protein